jgi:phosphatidylserine decarboxylase
MKRLTLSVTVTSVLFLIISLCSGCAGSTTIGAATNPASSPDDVDGHKVVQRLEYLVDTNATLRGEIEDALRAQTESSFWHDRTLEDMFDFFDEWLVFLPKPDDARKYMDAFYDFAGSGKGREIAAKEPLKSWLYEFVVARGQFMDSEESAAALTWWLNDPEMNMQDYIVPPDGYRSFNEFFTRETKPGVRTVDAPDDTSVLTSPADSTILKLADALTSDTELEVKGETLNIRELLAGDGRADKFINGRAMLCMLATTNYHRFHSPVEGNIVAERQLAGLYYGMQGGWVENFFEHRRGYFIFETEKFGHVGMVCVGMFTISSISFLPAEGDLVNKGDELGNFAYGGSAIVLLFEPNRVTFSIPIDERPFQVAMGQRIGSAAGQ